MKLKVVVPAGVLLKQDVAKVIAEAHNGSFCLMPRHVDFVAALTPGILAATTLEGQELFFAVDEGVLVKCGEEVLVSTRKAVQGALGELKQTVREEHRERGDRESKARAALDKLEASLVRQILDWEERGHA